MHPHLSQLGGLVVLGSLPVLLGQLGDQVRRFRLAVRRQAVHREDGPRLGRAIGFLPRLDAVQFLDPLQPGADGHGRNAHPFGVDVNDTGIGVVACDAGVWMPLAHDVF